jgi:hypothetical protein
MELARLTTEELLTRSRPLTAKERREWATKVRGRPAKPERERAVRVLFTIDPTLLRQVDAYARANDLSRAELIATGLRHVLKAG